MSQRTTIKTLSMPKTQSNPPTLPLFRLLGDDKGILKKIDADNNKDADETRSQ